MGGLPNQNKGTQPNSPHNFPSAVKCVLGIPLDHEDSISAHYGAECRAHSVNVVYGLVLLSSTEWGFHSTESEQILLNSNAIFNVVFLTTSTDILRKIGALV